MAFMRRTNEFKWSECRSNEEHIKLVKGYVTFCFKLQQKFIDIDTGREEWRDIPIEYEGVKK